MPNLRSVDLIIEPSTFRKDWCIFYVEAEIGDNQFLRTTPRTIMSPDFMQENVRSALAELRDVLYAFNIWMPPTKTPKVRYRQHSYYVTDTWRPHFPVNDLSTLWKEVADAQT